jgi:hypothetical protein
MTDGPRTSRGFRWLSRLRPSGPRQDEMRALHRRIDNLEAALSGLQDSTHRLIVQQNERLDELSKRTRPDQIARALSQDARDRGL